MMVGSFLYRTPVYVFCTTQHKGQQYCKHSTQQGSRPARLTPAAHVLLIVIHQCGISRCASRKQACEEPKLICALAKGTASLE